MTNYFWTVLLCVICLPLTAISADEPRAPGAVKETWARFDPRQDALDAKIVREWKQDGIVYRYVTYHIGSFKDKPARMAAFFGFPKDAKKLPGLLHLHGGGQRAFLKEVDADRLGVYGHSMGGNLTVYVAGTDNRVKRPNDSPSVPCCTPLPRKTCKVRQCKRQTDRTQ